MTYPLSLTNRTPLDYSTADNAMEGQKSNNILFTFLVILI